MYGAVTNDQLEAARLLISLGSDVNHKAKSSGRTPLHIAAMKGYISIAELLLGYGAQLDAKDNEGHTEEEIAIEHEEMEMAVYLQNYNNLTKPARNGEGEEEQDRNEIVKEENTEK